jgi:hypothetical protein
MSTYASGPPQKEGRRLPLLVVLVVLYQLAKAGFFAYVFLQCWDARESVAPPFGEVYDPLFKTPDFFLFLALAVYSFVLAIGLLCLGDWARACSLFLLLPSAGWWFLEQMSGHRSLLSPLDPSTMISAFAAEAIAIGILYVTPQAREAFAPAKPGKKINTQRDLF